MAPEQALGEPVDGRADLYSLGAVLYDLFTGRPPFQGDHALGVISQHVNAPVVPPRTLPRRTSPPALEAVILKLLAKSPGQRYASAVRDESRTRTGARSNRTPSTEARQFRRVAMLDALSRGRMVGRADELARMRASSGSARGRGAVTALLFSGEPGVGKTRLARELMIQAGLDGALVLWGACYEFEAATPHLPFAEALRRWVRAQTDTEALRAAAGRPRRGRSPSSRRSLTRPRSDRSPAHVDLPAHEERLLFIDAVAALFRALAGRRGLLFYVDDLHWADSATLWLLSHLLAASRRRARAAGRHLPRERARSRAPAVEGARRVEPRAPDDAHRAEAARPGGHARAALGAARRGRRRRPRRLRSTARPTAIRSSSRRS